MHGTSDAIPRLDTGTLSIYSLEVLARFNELLAAVETGYREYKFNEVAQRLYDFFWSDYCDWFIEAVKTEIFSEDEGRKKSVLVVMDFVLSGFLRLLHPFMPHITEELWSLLGFGKDSIQFAAPPLDIALNDVDLAKARKLVSAIYEIVEKARNLRVEAGIPSNKKIRMFIDSMKDELDAELPTIARLANAVVVTTRRSVAVVPTGATGSTSIGSVTVESASFDKSAERDRLDKEIGRLQNELRTVEAKLSNTSFVERAPAAVVQEHQQRKADFSDQLAQLRQARAAMD